MPQFDNLNGVIGPKQRSRGGYPSVEVHKWVYVEPGDAEQSLVAALHSRCCVWESVGLARTVLMLRVAAGLEKRVLCASRQRVLLHKTMSADEKAGDCIERLERAFLCPLLLASLQAAITDKNVKGGRRW